ncbi:MAG: MBL fold metallo-hydrolase [Calditrichota bacterium]
MRLTKMLRCVLPLMVLAGAMPLHAQPWEPGEGLTIRPLADGAYWIVHERLWPCNSLLVVMADSSLVLCDTPTDVPATWKLLQWMNEYFGPHPLTVFNSHYHVDCLGGNAALREAEIPSYGGELSAEVLTKQQQAIRERVAAGTEPDSSWEEDSLILTFRPPDHLFPLDSGMTLTFGGDSVICFYPGPAHTPDNFVIWFPSKKILFGGCMVKGGNSLGNTREADLEHWAESVSKLKRFPAEIVISGHSRDHSPEIVENTLRILAEQGGE